MYIRRSPKKRLRENVLAVCLALVLSFVVYQLAEHGGVLTADITGGPQPQFNEYSDIVVHQSANETLHIFAGKYMTDVESMSIVFLFDPERVVLEQDVFDSPYTIAYSPAGKGKGMVVLTDLRSTISVEDTLLQLGVAGTVDAIVVADVVAVFADGTQSSMAVQLPN